jgi:hypothetical protein
MFPLVVIIPKVTGNSRNPLQRSAIFRDGLLHLAEYAEAIKPTVQASWL